MCQSQSQNPYMRSARTRTIVAVNNMPNPFFAPKKNGGTHQLVPPRNQCRSGSNCDLARRAASGAKRPPTSERPERRCNSPKSRKPNHGNKDSPSARNTAAARIAGNQICASMMQRLREILTSVPVLADVQQGVGGTLGGIAPVRICSAYAISVKTKGISGGRQKLALLHGFRRASGRGR